MSERTRDQEVPLREGVDRRTYDIWIVGTGSDTEELLAMCLESQGHRPYLVGRLDEKDDNIQGLESVDVAVVDAAGSSKDAERAVRRLHEMRPDLSIVVMVGGGGAGYQRRLYAAGGTLVVEKPCDPPLLVTKIERAATRSGGNLYPESSGERPVDRLPGLEGSLSVLGVPELLLMLSQNQRTGWLEIRRGENRYRVALEEGAVVGASDACGVGGRKAAFRAIRQERGTFWYAERGSIEVEERLRDDFEGVDNLILLAIQEADELPRLLDRLPEPTATVEVVETEEAAWIDALGETASDALSCLRQRDGVRTVGEVIAQSNETDGVVARALKMAFERELLRVQSSESGPSSEFDQSAVRERRADTSTGV